jgi:hypothetical protein
LVDVQDYEMTQKTKHAASLLPAGHAMVLLRVL